jgi:crotonobetainyl-CoA:carnitine CoA-transferase CaiB-like acyl-CoA transferase
VAELAYDARFDTNPKRVALRDELSVLLGLRFVERTTAHWDKRFSERGVLFAPVNTFGDIFGHDQTEAMGYLVEVDHPTAGELKQIAPIIDMPLTPGTIRRPPPLLGQHTREILGEAGVSAEDVEDLLTRGVVKESKIPSKAP